MCGIHPFFLQRRGRGRLGRNQRKQSLTIVFVLSSSLLLLFSSLLLAFEGVVVEGWVLPHVVSSLSPQSLQQQQQRRIRWTSSSSSSTRRISSSQPTTTNKKSYEQRAVSLTCLHASKHNPPPQQQQSPQPNESDDLNNNNNHHHQNNNQKRKNIPSEFLHDNNDDDDDEEGEDTKEQPTNVTSSSSSSSSIEKKIRVARAQAEIDRILMSPAGGLDDDEWKNVVQMVPHPHELLQEENTDNDDDLQTCCQQMEQELYDAVKRQDYTTAAQKRTELDQLQYTHANAVLQINAAFYKAFTHKDTQKMSELWIPDSTATCIHPSHLPLEGYKNVMASWTKMFSNPNNHSFQQNWMEPKQIKLAVMGGTNMAIITCEEHVYVRRFVRGQTRQTEKVNILQATNVFRKLNQKWYLQYHHASWHADSPAAKQALQLQQQKSSNHHNQQHMYDENLKKPSLLQQRSGYYRKYDTGDDDKDNNNKNNNNSMGGLEGILGMQNFDPILGNEKPDDDEKPPKPTRRIVMGSLSDILSGDLADLLGPPPPSSSSSSSDNNNNNDINKMGQDGAIIRFARISSNDDDDDEDDDDDDDDVYMDDEDDEDDDDEEEEDLDDEDLVQLEHELKRLNQEQTRNDIHHQTKSNNNKGNNNKNNKAAVTIIQKWAKEQQQDNSSSSAQHHQQQQQRQHMSKETLRKRCIVTLRKLAKQGVLSPKQKRVLLTDIISASSRGESSMVEVAFELLCADIVFDENNNNNNNDSNNNNNNNDISIPENNNNNNEPPVDELREIVEEEFAEQCRVFAEDLML